MKKVVIILSIIIFLLSIIKEEIIIPDEAIRFRIIANSNGKNDQELKKEIVTNLTSELTKQNYKNIMDARKKIKKEIPKFTKIVDKTINDNNYKEDFHINYGKNYFPEKKYKNITYKAGEYESLVITLGEGSGQNFWCVLFPPLCLIDEEENNYPSLVKNVLDRYF